MFAQHLNQRRRRWHFPNAKVILTVRESNGWFDSVQATIAPLIAARGKHGDAHMNAIAEMAYKAIIVPLFDDRLSERDHAIRVFEDHITEVQATIPAKRLLTFDLREGWEPLCTFLRVDIPDMPLPKTNSSKEFTEQRWADR